MALENKRLEKERDKELQRANTETKQALDEKLQLLNRMSHRLQVPCNGGVFSLLRRSHSKIFTDILYTSVAKGATTHGHRYDTRTDHLFIRYTGLRSQAFGHC